MAIQTFVNLPVKDLKKTMDFFSKLGFQFNPQFTDEKAACMIVSSDTYYMLLTEKFFMSFTHKELPDTKKFAEVINSFMFDSKSEVDKFADKAMTLGASKYRDPEDMGFMYGRSFQDLDGHLWEVGWMDPKHVM